MDDHVYKHVRITGTSQKSMEEAVQNAVEKAAKSVRHMGWFKIVETRGSIEGGNVDRWQVIVEIGFRLED